LSRARYPDKHEYRLQIITNRKIVIIVAFIITLLPPDLRFLESVIVFVPHFNKSSSIIRLENQTF